MRYLDVLLEYKTKDGRDITFEVIEDEEGDNNRGWQIDRINAFVDGKPAGYLKLSYIPHKRFNRYYPSIFNWMAQIQGKGILPYRKKDKHWSTFTPDEKRDLIKKLIGYYRYHSKEDEEKLELFSDDELNSQIAELEKKAMKSYGKEFKGFQQYFVDKPYEDYIRVFSRPGEEVNPRDRESNVVSDANYTRQGIATALYFKAVAYLAKKGMRMRLSQLRSDDAQGLESAIKKAGLTTPGKTFYYSGETQQFDFLDPKKVSAYQKKHGLTEELVMERSYDEWMDIISRLEAQARAEDKDPREKMLYREKAKELKAKLAKESPQDEKSPRKYTNKGGLEPYPLKGTTVDTSA